MVANAFIACSEYIDAVDSGSSTVASISYCSKASVAIS